VDSRGVTLANWDINDRLSNINVPTLVVNGKDDIAQDFVIQGFLDHIPKSYHLKFQKSSHTPFWEERVLYMVTVGAFLL
jgi:pimeloyl-ACP methyl ester carboxylesterase